MGAQYGGLPAANTESVRARGFLVWQSRVNAAFGSPPYHCASLGAPMSTVLKGGQLSNAGLTPLILAVMSNLG